MGLDLDAEAHLVHLVVTCGSTEAMMSALLTACAPGDRVIVFSPFYENHGADSILSGAVPLSVELRPPDFRFDPDELRRAFQQRPKALALCNPSNPSGHVFSPEELQQIADLAQDAHMSPGRPRRSFRHSSLSVWISSKVSAQSSSAM